MRFVIIGAGAAGISALQTIRSLDKESDITVVSKENVPPYSLSSLPFNLSGEVEDKAMPRFPEGFFDALTAKVVIGRVKGLDIEGRRVLFDGGTDLLYDRLLVASGSSPIVPRITGLEKRGVHFMGSITDTWRLRDAASSADKIIVIGAGFVGLEAAIALSKLGKHVTVVEMLDRVLPRMLDPDMAAIVQKMLEDHGLQIRLGDQVTEVLGEERVAGVRLTKGELECDLVVLGIGVRPNLDFVKGSAVKTNMGIVVDEMMRTTAENVYAAGDVVEAIDPLTGKPKIAAIWPNAIEQGRVAGRNMAGVATRYSGIESVNIINIFDVPVVALGLTSADVQGTEAITAKREKTIRKLLIKDDVAVGLQSIGGVRNLGFVLDLINKRQKLGSLRGSLLDDRFAYPVATR